MNIPTIPIINGTKVDPPRCKTCKHWGVQQPYTNGSTEGRLRCCGGEKFVLTYDHDDYNETPDDGAVVERDGSEQKSGVIDFFGGDTVVYRAGKKLTGRLLDGQLHDGYPEVRP